MPQGPVGDGLAVHCRIGSSESPVAANRLTPEGSLPHRQLRNWSDWLPVSKYPFTAA